LAALRDAMSGGTVCRCPEAKKPIKDRRWYVYQRHCNHSAFSGYKETRSQYSGLCCDKCRAHWRTKADYVHDLADAT
jgi:hypothetical protein